MAIDRSLSNCQQMWSLQFQIFPLCFSTTQKNESFSISRSFVIYLQSQQQQANKYTKKIHKHSPSFLSSINEFNCLCCTMPVPQTWDYGWQPGRQQNIPSKLCALPSSSQIHRVLRYAHKTIQVPASSTQSSLEV